jgi:hypothetical protein
LERETARRIRHGTEPPGELPRTEWFVASTRIGFLEREELILILEATPPAAAIVVFRCNKR